MSPRISWEGVFPAVTTQFHDDLSLDIDATAKVMDGLIRDGVSGLIICGSVGENTSLERKEKIAIMETAKSVAAGRVPVLCGIAEFTTAFAVDTAKEAARVGIDGMMVMPALVYSSKPHETAAHFRSVATATDLPVMLYNNPPIYKNDVTPDILATLADVETVVCFKDSSATPGASSTPATWSAIASCCLPASTTSLSRASRWARSAGSPACRMPSRARARPCSGSPRQAAMPRRCRCTNGSCRCCISMRVRTSSSASSFASTSSAAAPR